MSFWQYLSRMLNSSRSFFLFASFAGLFFMRTSLLPLSHDDYAYAFIWDGAHGGNLEAMMYGDPELEIRQRVSAFSDIFQSMYSHYFTWGGRVFAHAIAQFFIWIGKPYFDVANTIIFILLVLTIINLSNNWLKISRIALIWVSFSMFILSACSLTSLFWLTGACNYMWMSFFQLLFLTPYAKAVRSNEAGDSTLNLIIMILLGFLAGCSNEAGALATVCLNFFLIIKCKMQKISRTWMVAGFISLVIGCTFMFLAPGNFARLEFAHPDFQYSYEIFSEHFSESKRIFIIDLIALIPLLIYFFRRKSSQITTTEVLMFAFSVAGFIVPIAMIFSPEFNSRISVTSLSFILVAATSAILELERQNTFHGISIKLPRGILMILIITFVIYFATLIYTDISIFNAERRQVRYIYRNSLLDPIPMPIMPIRHRFEKIHGDKSAAAYLKFFAGINENPNYCLNLLVAQYYGVKHIVGSD